MWTVSRSTLKLTLRRDRPVPFAVHRYYGGPVLTQEIYLEPIESQMIFGAPRLLQLDTRSDFVTIDDLGNVAVPLATARAHYTVESEPETGDPRRADVADARLPHDPRWQARYTQLPAVSPRIRALAREVTAGSRDPYDAARRLSAWLGREIAYTRVLERPSVEDPLEDFLFVRRAGNCEYFAAALAVMLRPLQLPAAWSTASSAASGTRTGSTSSCASGRPLLGRGLLRGPAGSLSTPRRAARRRRRAAASPPGCGWTHAAVVVPLRDPAGACTISWPPPRRCGG